MVLPYLIQKEFKQIFRNSLLPRAFVMMPFWVMLLVPLIATQEVKGLKFAVIDNDHSVYSQRLINKVDASTYLDLTVNANTYDEAMVGINSSDADVIIEIPKNYGRDVAKGQAPSIGIYANATDGTKGGMSTQYISQILQNFNQELKSETGAIATTKGLKKSPFVGDVLSARYFFNPGLDYKPYMIPAVFGLILILIVGFLPALNIVSEKEKGTIEQINVSPIGKVEFIISKIVPYVIVGLVMSAEAMVAGYLFFGILPAGNIATVFMFCLIFSMLVSSLGLIVSNYSSTIQQASLTMFFFLVIFIIMSGLLTPIASMPQWAQDITYVNPMRYFLEVMRYLYVKGSTIPMLMPQLIALVVYTLLGWTFAILSYKKNG